MQASQVTTRTNTKETLAELQKKLYFTKLSSVLKLVRIGELVRTISSENHHLQAGVKYAAGESCVANFDSILSRS
jgi:hypothetical protein